MPKEFSIIYMYETHPELYNLIPSPDGRQVAEGIPEKEKLYKDICA